MIDTDIQKALCAWLKSPDLGYPIAWPLIKFTPIARASYIDARPVMRVAPQNLSIDFGGSNIFRGVFQIDAVTADDIGEAPGLEIAGLIAARFALGTNIIAGGRRLQILKIPAIATASVDDAPWARFPVSVAYLLIN